MPLSRRYNIWLHTIYVHRQCDQSIQLSFTVYNSATINEKKTQNTNIEKPSFFSDQLPKETAQIRFSTDSIAEKNVELSRDNKALFRFRVRQ